MILKADNVEVACLLLHMTITRKNARNGFKKNYGKVEGKEVLKSYDNVKETLEEFIEAERQEGDLHYNIKEIEMIDSFLSWYTIELEKTLNAAGDILDEDKKQLDCLNRIESKIKKLKEVQGA